MEAKIINQFPIRNYLAGSGIHPVKENSEYGMYHSPVREDHNASLRVNYNKNLWMDFGTGKGGTLIDLVMRLENCTAGKAMQLLEQTIAGTASFSFHRGKDFIANKPSQQAISIHNVDVLNNPSLLSYLHERCVNIEIARLHCQEVYYSVNGKSYFAVGFRNDSEGYELRNKYFKGCTSKDITSVKASTNINSCQLFEGFMDYLSFLTIKNWEQSKTDVIVLNSLTNLPKVKNTLTAYRSIATFFDNDEAGKRAVQQLKSCHPNVDDQSEFYAKHKDLN
jgi:hypothetical protein